MTDDLEPELQATLNKSDEEIMADWFQELLGWRPDQASPAAQFTFEEVMKISFDSFEQGKDHMEMLNKARASVKPSS
jgi:hypothetical protein